MKRLVGTDISGSYTFNPAAKTVTFTGLQYNLTLANILLITNTTANTIIYNFADPTSGAVSFNNNVLTLDYNTTSMGSTDVLQIYVDVEGYEESLAALLRRMNKLLESNATVDARLRQKVVIDAVGNLTGTSAEISGTIPISGSVTINSSVSGSLGGGVGGAVNATSQNAGNPYTTTSLNTSPFFETPVDQRWRIIDDSRNCYANLIRSKLTFS